MRAAVAIAFAVFLASATASASPGINGYSGRPIFGMMDTCDTNCHKPPSNPAPTITINLPQTVQAGSKTDVTLVINGTRARTSFNAGFTDGVVVTAGQNTNVPFPVETPWEVVAKDPPPSGASGTYTFSFTAPKENGTVTLYIAAMSASGAGTANDGVLKTTRTFTVTGGTNPSTSSSGGTTSTSSTSSTSSSSSGGAADGGGSSSSGDGESASSSGSGATGRRLPSSDDGGCNVVASSREDASVAWLAVAFAVTAAAAARGRARRRSTARERS